MKTLHYKISFFSYWHTGSGLSGGADLNATVIKSEDHLPYIPGKTLKGLIRDAAENLHEIDAELVDANFIKEVFGGENRETYLHPGCFFSNAQVAPKLAQEIVDEQLHPFLYDRLASTRIDEQGQALDNTLRHIEVSIPLTLYAYVDDFPSSLAYDKALESCFQWIKQLGMNRTRGLGRCQFQSLT